MKLSTRGRYGVRAMLELAMQAGNGPVPLRDLASKQEISAKYLEQLLIPLKGAGLVKSVRGARGGYMLATSPEKVNLYDIVRSLEGPLAPVECVQDPQILRTGGRLHRASGLGRNGHPAGGFPHQHYPAGNGSAPAAEGPGMPAGFDSRRQLMEIVR